MENLSKMSAIPCPLPKITNPLDPSQGNYQEVYVYNPNNKEWIKWKSSKNNPEVDKGCHRQDMEEKFTSVPSEPCADRKEETKNLAVERKLSDWLMPEKDDSLEDPMTRPMWDKTWKKKPKRCFGSTKKQTEQEVCESMKHILEIPCLSLESLLFAVSDKGHHIHLDADRYCKDNKSSPSKSSKETGGRGARINGKDAGKRCRITKRHLWQMVDEDGKALPFGAVSSKVKGPNDEERNGADIWIRLDCVSVLITKIIAEMKRDRSRTKCETHVESEEENSSIEPAEETEFVDVSLEQSSSELHSWPLKKEPDVSSEICHHEALMAETSTEDSLQHPKKTLNSMETRGSSVSHEGSGSGEIQITDMHPSTSSSSESQENCSIHEMFEMLI